jgi:hypothetical protein
MQQMCQGVVDDRFKPAYILLREKGVQDSTTLSVQVVRPSRKHRAWQLHGRQDGPRSISSLLGRLGVELVDEMRIIDVDSIWSSSYNGTILSVHFLHDKLTTCQIYYH